ncbi:hypothetical protein MHYP_G00255160 [Metynnis hypsauchen]
MTHFLMQAMTLGVTRDQRGEASLLTQWPVLRERSKWRTVWEPGGVWKRSSASVGQRKGDASQIRLVISMALSRHTRAIPSNHARIHISRVAPRGRPRTLQHVGGKANDTVQEARVRLV